MYSLLQRDATVWQSFSTSLLEDLQDNNNKCYHCRTRIPSILYPSVSKQTKTIEGGLFPFELY